MSSIITLSCLCLSSKTCQCYSQLWFNPGISFLLPCTLSDCGCQFCHMKCKLTGCDQFFSGHKSLSFSWGCLYTSQCNQSTFSMKGHQMKPDFCIPSHYWANNYSSSVFGCWYLTYTGHLNCLQTEDNIRNVAFYRWCPSFSYTIWILVFCISRQKWSCM